MAGGVGEGCCVERLLALRRAAAPHSEVGEDLWRRSRHKSEAPERPPTRNGCRTRKRRRTRSAAEDLWRRSRRKSEPAEPLASHAEVLYHQRLHWQDEERRISWQETFQVHQPPGGLVLVVRSVDFNKFHSEIRNFYY